MRSSKQVAQREVFLAARDEWSWLTADEKVVYAEAADPMKMTGYNRFLKRFLQGDERRYTRLLLPMQEGAGSVVADRSGYGNNGTVYGATWTRLPSGVWALAFDGTDDYVNLGNDVSLQMSNNLTASIWITLKRTAQYEYFLAKGYAWVAGWWLQKDQNSTNIVFNYLGAGGGHTSGGIPLTLDIPALLIFTFSSGVIRRYHNGVYLGSNTFADTTIVGTATTPLYLGRQSTAGYPTLCNLASVRLYARVLTDPEIARLFAIERPLYSL